MGKPLAEVAVIGAGVSGIAAATHLRDEGLQVTVFERAPVPGGVWVYDPRVPPEPAYPSTTPSKAEFSFYEGLEGQQPGVIHSPPGPCYDNLKNNVPTQLLELSLNKWKDGTPSFTTHHTLLEYLRDTAEKTGLAQHTLYNTRVESLQKVNGKWIVSYSTFNPENRETETSARAFDGVVVATGHYHAPRVPAIPGLAEWKTAWPSRIKHSKGWRRAEGFDNQSVLIIGGSTSATDIAKELGPIAKKIWQSTRNGQFDHPAFELPPNASRVSEVASFGPLQGDAQRTTRAISGRITLVDGQILEDIDRVIVCTGYHFSIPFLPELHHDDVESGQADGTVLVTDGTMLHNLHKDIFYIPDPTLAFIGVPFHIATFSFFEFQAVAVAAAFSGHADIPSGEVMRAEYEARVREKGLGKGFHALMGQDVKYVSQLMEWVNQGREPSEIKTRGYSKEWVELQAGFIKKFLEFGTDHAAKK